MTTTLPPYRLYRYVGLCDYRNDYFNPRYFRAIDMGYTWCDKSNGFMKGDKKWCEKKYNLSKIKELEERLKNGNLKVWGFTITKKGYEERNSRIKEEIRKRKGLLEAFGEGDGTDFWEQER